MKQQQVDTIDAWLQEASRLGITAAALRTTEEIRAVGDEAGVTVGPVCWVQVLGYAGGLLLRTPRLQLDPAAAEATLLEAGLLVRRSVDHLY